jgi:hypothetical protein
MKPDLNLKVNFEALERYLTQRAHIAALFDVVSKPLKFPPRRRRQDREIPKAA